MIRTAISYGFGDDNRYNLRYKPTSIQLALYKYFNYFTLKEKIFKDIYDIEVVAVHMPLDTLIIDRTNIINMIKEVSRRSKCKNFVIHPNKGFVEFAISVYDQIPDIKLCIETFGWKSNKDLRTPLDIIEFINLNRLNYKMVFDTSHVDYTWFDYKILPYLLKYTNIIHLSNRSKIFGQHLPFNDSRGDLNLVEFIKDLVNKYHWNGDIVLEYMGEYGSKLNKNIKYLQTLLK